MIQDAAPRLELIRALSYSAGGLTFRRGRPTPCPNEGLYNRLIRLGHVRDVDKDWESIHPKTTLPKLKAGETVLVVRDMGLGDVLMVSIVIRELALQYPHLKWIYAVSTPYVPLFRDCQFLEKVVSIFRATGRSPHTIELRGYSERAENRTMMDRIDLFAQYCGVKVEDYSIPLTPRSEEVEAGKAIVGKAERPVVGVALRGSTRVRTWPHVQKFVRLAADEGYQVAVFDQAPQEVPEHPRIVDTTGKLNCKDLIGALAACDYVVAPDTGLVHLAEAVGTRSLAVYSTTPPGLRLAHYRKAKALWRSDLPCAPCHDRGCQKIPCLATVTAEMVMNGLKSWQDLSAETNPMRLGDVPSETEESADHEMAR